MDYRGGKDAQSCYRALKKRGFDFADAGDLLPAVRELLAEIYAKSHKGKELPVKYKAESEEGSNDNSVAETGPMTE